MCRAVQVACVLVLLLHAAAAHAHTGEAPLGDEIIQLDGARSQVDFKVKVMWLLSVSGSFGKVHGTVRVDAFRNQLQVDARIDVNAVSMNNASYEDWVKSAEFFDAARHPQIAFESDAFSRARLRSGGELAGELTVRGVRQSVSFELQPSACAVPAYECPIRVNGTIRRSAFGMGSHRGSISDKVHLAFSVYATRTPDTSVAPKPG